MIFSNKGKSIIFRPTPDDHAINKRQVTGLLTLQLTADVLLTYYETMIYDLNVILVRTQRRNINCMFDNVE